MDKTVGTAREAVADIPSGAKLAVGGFGVCGIPSATIRALAELGVSDLEIWSNNCGVDGTGLGTLLEQRQVRRVIASYIGGNKEFARQYLAGELELELSPQGTLAERLRAGGMGIPAFYTPAGVGTAMADGGIPWRYGTDGAVAVESPPKEVRTFPGEGGTRDYVLEHGLRADFALVRAARGDRAGNLVFHSSARNFNPLCAMAGRTTVAEVEQLVEEGDLDPDEIHLPGIFIDRVVPLDEHDASDKPTEKLTFRTGQETS
ncbi:CoA transferase subunit A [Streptomyces scopuliridis]|uniref:CoA transferase subunit A n=1 Tax=Streptomyces scopuliridis TaxID=452529 RepID=UPI00368D0232